jgi:hypothetical protein
VDALRVLQALRRVPNGGTADGDALHAASPPRCRRPRRGESCRPSARAFVSHLPNRLCGRERGGYEPCHGRCSKGIAHPVRHTTTDGPGARRIAIAAADGARRGARRDPPSSSRRTRRVRTDAPLPLEAAASAEHVGGRAWRST